MQCPECGSYDTVNRVTSPDYDPDEEVSYWECSSCGATWEDEG